MTEVSALTEALRTIHLFDNSLVAMSLTSLEGQPLAINAAAHRMFKTTPEMLTSTTVLDVTHPDDREATAAVMARLRTGEIDSARLEKRYIAKDGALVWGDASITLLRDDAGHPTAWLTLIVDITERMQLEDELRAATSAAEKAAAARSDLLSRVSHELRTPLTAILGFAELLKVDEPSLVHTDWIDTILRAGEHLLHLVEDVLDISRGATLPLDVVRVSVTTLIREGIELVEPEANRAGVTVTYDGSHDETFVLGDPRRLKQIVVNLLSNAVKYNQPGGDVRVEVARPDAGSRVRIDVSDSGSGIAANDMGRLFIPFERFNRARPGIPGVGLGLALSRVLAEAMGGSMGATSVPGQGSTFWLEVAAATADISERVVSTRPAGTEARAYAQERTVLCIEDTPSTTRFVEQVVKRRLRLTLVVAESGQAGLELARLHKPDLVLLDVQLPDMKGDAVLDGLRADPATEATPVVVFTADVTQATADRFAKRGPDGYLVKPISVEELLRTLDSHLD